MMWRFRAKSEGYLTVYLVLVMTLVLSLCLTLIEGVRTGAIRAEVECVTEIGFYSILAEYHRELLEQYNLFAIDSSYGTTKSGTEDIMAHLRGYMERNFSAEETVLSELLYRDFLGIEVSDMKITEASIFTDANGAVFRQQAVEAIRDDCNLTLLEEIKQWFQIVEDNGLRDRDVASEKQKADEELQAYEGKEIYISETESQEVHVENPMGWLEQIRGNGILEYVVEDVSVLSDKVIYQDNLIWSRMQQNKINQGNIPQESEETASEQLLERFLFQEYLMSYMGHYGKEKGEGALSYQIEYLLAGADGDAANLRQTVSILCAVREAANIIYLFSDSQKCAEAEAVAALTAALLLVPEMTSALKMVLLFGWAFAESLYDVKTILAGGRISLIKDKTNWHYDLNSVLSRKDKGDESDSGMGLGYEDYLRLFMMFTDLDTLTGRAMNIVEADLRLTPGNQNFRLDNCYSQVEACIGIKSRYGYEYEITRRRGY